MAAQPGLGISAALARLGVEERFHSVLAKLCGGEAEYLSDILAEDIQGCCDADGNAIPAPVARGLVRKLNSAAATSTCVPSSGDAADTSIRKGVDKTGVPMTTTVATDVGTCTVALCRGAGDYASMVKCEVRGQVGSSSDNAQRRKVLTAVLDNSGSMRNEWPLVVDALSRVFTDDLLRDPLVSLIVVVYNTHATEVVLPAHSSELSRLLLTSHRPGGITNFQSAFRLAETLIDRQIRNHVDHGLSRGAIDVTTLLFTDGEDTSVPPHGSKSPEATAKARAAGDAFREFLRTSGCPAHTCIAAFGQQHNPEQCQYLCDRYYYINRKEVLGEWLTGGLAELLESSGHCSLHVGLPPCLTLAEPLPTSIGLDPEGRIEYEVWLRADAATSHNVDAMLVCDVEESGSVALRASANLRMASVVDLDTFDGHLFLLDSGEMQLREIARELRGRRPRAEEMALLQERLVGVRELVQPVLEKATTTTSRLKGRMMLRARLEELETRRNRLSYALGHFDEGALDTRQIGAVGIDAILRDASQRVPIGPVAAAAARRVRVAATLPDPESLSSYGQQLTLDPFSRCDAHATAEQGDGMFFCLRTPPGGGLAGGKDDCSKLLPFETFMLLSRNGATAVTLDEEFQDFTHLGIPIYATPGHFLRAKLQLPLVLERFYAKGSSPMVSERILLELLGCSLGSYLNLTKRRPADDISLFHKARSVLEIFGETITPAGWRLLDDVTDKANNFIDDVEHRASCRDLYSIVATGLLARDWSSARLQNLGDAVVEEASKRAVARHLENKSESQRLRLAWATLGPRCHDDSWLDERLAAKTNKNEVVGAFDILTASDELEELERREAGVYSPREPALILEALASETPPGTLPVQEWGPLRMLLSRWSDLIADEGGAVEVWRKLDRLMTDDDMAENTLARFGKVLNSGQQCVGLRHSFKDPNAALAAIAGACLRSRSKQMGRKGETNATADLPPRLALASALRAIVSKREQFARKYPIRGSAYPSSNRITAAQMHEGWGAPAEPVDAALFRKARSEVHQRHASLRFVVKEALSDKAYRQQGGRFAFPSSFDTFIPGLHRRISDLHGHWKRKGKSKGSAARAEAVEEMLLRLRWDDSNHLARAKLSKIIAQIWLDLEGDFSNCEPVSSALWLDDDASEGDTTKARERGVSSATSCFGPPARAEQNTSENRTQPSEVGADGEAEWKMV